MDMYNKIKTINKLLEDQGAKVVQKKPGMGNMGPLYGYLPQAVFEAVASTVPFSNTVDHFEFTEKQAIAQATVVIDQTTHTQFGESRIVKGDRGSAIKGAVTDAIQKALALFGIGSKAYRGELENVFNKKVSHTVVDDNYEALKTAASEASNLGIEEGRAWWRQNLVHIQILTKEQRADLVETLAGPVDKK
jgi:hypothetical protein